MPISRKLSLAIVVACASIYFFSNPRSQSFFDYTFRVADNIVHGRIGLAEQPPPWLNEFVPFDGTYYSVFPLGSVITMIPFAIAKATGIITEMPGGLIGAFIAAAGGLLLLQLAQRYEVSRSRAIVMAAGMLFGTWAWTNITVAGAWQLALGFSFVGELGAIYFVLFDRRPLIAGAFFALAFGNRTEVLLTAPIFLYLLWRAEPDIGAPKMNEARSTQISRLIKFCVFPFVLGVATLLYNYIRFGSFADFGYARIPGVLNEPWYIHGIFSPYYIPRQVWEMLLKGWDMRDHFPLPMPNGFSSSILISSPFLLFAFRSGWRDRVVKYAAWAAVITLCLILWMHGNSGGWQFGYRYAIVCLPWLFVIMLESAPKRLTNLEISAYVFSIAANAYATWLFHWTENIRP